MLFTGGQESSEREEKKRLTSCSMFTAVARSGGIAHRNQQNQIQHEKRKKEIATCTKNILTLAGHRTGLY
jgi:hypothetical protein